MKAVYKDTVFAESNRTEIVENNHYFPREDVKMEYFTKSDKQYTCPWKGDATYYHIQVGEEQLKNAAWSYENPKEKAKNITGHLAFEKQYVKP